MSIVTREEMQAHVTFPINYVILAYIDDGKQFHIYHICAYQNPPTGNDLTALKFELANDKEFQLPKGVLEKLDYAAITIEEYEEFINLNE